MVKEAESNDDCRDLGSQRINKPFLRNIGRCSILCRIAIMILLCMFAVMSYINVICTFWNADSAKSSAIGMRHSMLPWRACALRGQWDMKFNSSEMLLLAASLEKASASLACFRELSEVVRAAESAIFLGDSTIKMLFGNLVGVMNSTQIYLPEKKNRCTMLNVMNVSMEERLEDWLTPNFTKMEGPINYGLCGTRWCHLSDLLTRGGEVTRKRGERGVGCTDCSGCEAQKFVWIAKKTEEEKRLLYLPVEFAKDVAQQSLNVQTTQEQVGRFIAREYKNAICFVAAGVHDQILPVFDEEQWKTNMRDYLKDELLGRGGCRVVVVLTLAAVLGDKRMPQTNSMGKLLNAKLIELEVEGFEEGWGSQGRFGVLDIYNVSDFNELHSNNIHMHDFFYSELARLIMGA